MKDKESLFLKDFLFFDMYDTIIKIKELKMRFPLKILNKKKFVLCFINAFMTNLFFLYNTSAVSIFYERTIYFGKIEVFDFIDCCVKNFGS